MRKIIYFNLAIFFASSFIFLFLNPDSLGAFQRSVNNADILFPFSLYQGLLNPTSKMDWVFGGYTPFFELLVGFIFWFFSRDIQTTFVLYAIFQPTLVTLSLLFLSNRILGNHSKIIFLVVVFTASPIFLFSSGLFSVSLLFSWYSHITTACIVLVAFALLIQFLTSGSSENKNVYGLLLFVFILIVIATMSDAIFIAQFTIPAVSTIIFMVIFKVIPFRKSAYTVLTILYATAAGLGLYRLPSIWGSERLALYGSYFRLSLDRIIQAFFVLTTLIPGAWGGSPWISAIWVIFYGFCLVILVSSIRNLRRGLGNIQRNLFFFATFLLAQMITVFGSGLLTNTPGNRYFLPIIFTPLFWGWPFLLMAFPRWMKLINGKRLIFLSTALPVAALLLLGLSGLSLRNIHHIWDYSPEFVECIDQNANKYNLHKGMANYWQARPVTLLSKTGLVVVQVDSGLSPFRILNNSDGYHDDLDFVLISHSPDPGLFIDRVLVMKKFGQPAISIYCEQNEILVYNRVEDIKFKNHFQSFLQNQP